MGWGYSPYVTVAERRERAQRKMDKLRKQGMHIQGVEIEGRKIARTFWGKSWCGHLESFSDYANRLPRGRTYVCNGSVCHLAITAGEIKAIVSGSELYDVKIKIKPLLNAKWCAVKQRCAGQIGSLLELLQGRLSSSVMTVVTDRQEGIFPLPSEIKLECSCPDYATMCKHVAAVLYGVAARLDEKPDLLFLLRGVDHEELIEADAAVVASAIDSKKGGRRIAESALEDLFGIEMVADKPSSNNGGRSGSNEAKGKSEKREPLHLDKSPRNVVLHESENTISRIDPLTKGKVEILTSKKSTNTRLVNSGTSVASNRSQTNGAKAGRTARADNSQTGKTIRELRARLGLTQSELARLTGVSPATVCTWEKTRGRLKLQQRSLSALNMAAKLTKKQAVRNLNKLQL